MTDATDALHGAARRPAPEGFNPHFRRSPLTDPWEPLYSQRLDDAVRIGLWVRPEHCNSRELLHGGLISALADNAMGLSCSMQRLARDESSAASTKATHKGSVTVSLALDFLGTARVGQWLEVRPRVLKLTRALGFVDSEIWADDALIARANATFRLA